MSTSQIFCLVFGVAMLIFGIGWAICTWRDYKKRLSQGYSVAWFGNKGLYVLAATIYTCDFIALIVMIASILSGRNVSDLNLSPLFCAGLPFIWCFGFTNTQMLYYKKDSFCYAGKIYGRDELLEVKKDIYSLPNVLILKLTDSRDVYIPVSEKNEGKIYSALES